MVRSRIAPIGLVMLLSGVLTAAGCGDDLPGAGTLPFHSRVDGTRQLDMLTPEEATIFCEDFTAHTDDFVHRPRVIEGACRFHIDQSTPTCEDMKSECIAELAMKPGSVTCPQWSAPCGATIADFERCWTATERFFVQVFFALPDCDEPGSGLHGIETAAEEKRAECAAFFEGCPGG
jgi:hypothetical protein